MPKPPHRVRSRRKLLDRARHESLATASTSLLFGHLACFLKQIDREVPKDLEIHLIADNYSTHKHRKVEAWLGKHKRFHRHFTPTSSSWMNPVERFFADLTRDCVCAGRFASLQELTNAITTYVAERNENPKPYKWKASGKEILAKIRGARQALAAPEDN